MSKKPKKINTLEQRYKASEPMRKNIVRALFFVNALFWLGYVIYLYYDMAVVNHNKSSADIASIFTLVIAIAGLVSGIVLGKFQKSPFYFSLVVAALNIILCLPNLQENFFLTIFVLDAAILWLLYQLRKSYLS